MREWIQQQLRLPEVTNDVEKTRLTQKVHIALWVITAGAGATMIILPLMVPERAYRLYLVAPLFPILMILFIMNRRGYSRLTAFSLMIALWLMITAGAATAGGIRASASPVYAVIVLFTALLFGIRAALGAAAVCALTGLGMVYAEEIGLISSSALPTTLIGFWLAQFLTLFAAVGLVYLAVRDIREALGRAHKELAERQRAEEKLRASEERFRAMIENVSDAIALVNAQGQIFYLSPTSERILGYSVDERTGFSAFDNLMQPEDVSKLQSIFRELEAEPKATRSFILQARHKDGSTRWIEATAKNLLDLASVQAIVVNYRNVTERVHAEKEREKYIEELGRQNAELERFTYTVSHDLKSPLVTIMGFLGALEKDLQDGRQDRLQSDFQRITRAASKMGHLLSELLELSRIGRIINPPEEVDLVKLTQEAVENLDARIRSKNVAVKISQDLPRVSGDRIRLREVLENLIDNAAKYMGDQPNPVIEIGTRNHSGNPVIFVKDNGIGIEPQYQTKIFGLFEKLDPTSEGTGIGLALIKRIVEVHGGRIWVESEGLGKGSMFCFTIPDGRKQ